MSLPLIDSFKRLVTHRRKKIPNPLRCGPLTVFHHGAEVESQNILKMVEQAYEPEATAVFIEILKPGMQVVDVGAYLGYYSLMAASKLKGKVLIWAFEPVWSTYELLKKNIAANHFEKSIIPIQMGVGSTVTQTRILKHGIPARSSFYHRDGFDETKFDLVKVATLDSFFSELNWPPIDLIKVDVEGAEKEVFFGMKEFTTRNANLKMIVEYNPAALKPAAVNAQAFFETLQAVGFKNFYLIEEGRAPITPSQGYFSEIEKFATKQTFNVNILCTKEKTEPPLG